jgi:hypothetical protein
VLPSLAGDAHKDVLAKNYAITAMRTEIKRRPRHWGQYHWVLGYTRNPEHPFITSDQAVGMRGDAPTIGEAFQRNDFWLWCPLSWDICLVASSQPLTAEAAAELRPEHVTEIPMLTRRQSEVFIASPCAGQNRRGAYR